MARSISVTVPIIDWHDPDSNSFLITEELELLTSDGTRTRRPDMVGYVNGIPLVVIEAKRPDSGNPNSSMVEEGISQMIRNQKADEIPQLFAYAQLLAFDQRDRWALWHHQDASANSGANGTRRNSTKPISPGSRTARLGIEPRAALWPTACRT